MRFARSVLLTGVVAATAAVTPSRPAARAAGNPAALPDYIVTEVSTSDYDTVKARVKNQGVITAGPCYMAITIKTTDGQRKVFSPKVNGLAPGQEVEMSAKTGLNLIQADYEALVDRSNSVKESDETNNTLKGKFGGKP